MHIVGELGEADRQKSPLSEIGAGVLVESLIEADLGGLVAADLTWEAAGV